MKTITQSKVSNINLETGEINKKNVCVYARVSTKKELQLTSFELQISTYYKRIMDNPLWQFAGVFSDYGRSGTNTRRRAEFNKMIEMCRLGEIDIILTKSVSRFARNTIDALTTIQELRALGVEVIFETENISSLDTNFDFYLSVAVSVAEEESKSNSKNVLWSVRKRFEEGMENKVTQLYGYFVDEKGDYHIVEEQAKVIRFIFDEYISGTSIRKIIDRLEEMQIKTFEGASRFGKGTIYRILKNEKYCGDVLLQKGVTQVVGSKLTTKNHNLKTKYYVENNHIGIVSKETFQLANKLREERSLNNGTSAGSKVTYTPYNKFVYDIQTHKFFRYKVNNKGKKWELKLFELYKSDEGTGSPSIHFRQVEEILQEVYSMIAKDIKGFKALVSQELISRIKYSDIEEKLNTLEHRGQEIEDRLLQTSGMLIDEDAKASIRQRLIDDKHQIDKELATLRCEKALHYSYDKNLTELERKIRLKTSADFELFQLRDFFSSVISLNRENLIVCIHLSNRNLKEITLENEITNSSLFEGVRPYVQTRLSLNTKWKVIII